MQEEVEQRVVTLIVDCAKLTEQELRKALGKLLEQMKSSVDSRFVVRCVLLLRKLRGDKALQKQYGPQLCKVIRRHLNRQSRAFLTRQVWFHALLAKIYYKLYFTVIDLKK